MKKQEEPNTFNFNLEMKMKQKSHIVHVTKGGGIPKFCCTRTRKRLKLTNSSILRTHTCRQPGKAAQHAQFGNWYWYFVLASICKFIYVYIHSHNSSQNYYQTLQHYTHRQQHRQMQQRNFKIAASSQKKFLDPNNCLFRYNKQNKLYR